MATSRSDSKDIDRLELSDAALDALIGDTATPAELGALFRRLQKRLAERILAGELRARRRGRAARVSIQATNSTGRVMGRAYIRKGGRKDRWTGRPMDRCSMMADATPEEIEATPCWTLAVIKVRG